MALANLQAALKVLGHKGRPTSSALSINKFSILLWKARPQRVIIVIERSPRSSKRVDGNLSKKNLHFQRKQQEGTIEHEIFISVLGGGLRSHTYGFEGVPEKDGKHKNVHGVRTPRINITYKSWTELHWAYKEEENDGR